MFVPDQTPAPSPEQAANLLSRLTFWYDTFMLCQQTNSMRISQPSLGTGVPMSGQFKIEETFVSAILTENFAQNCEVKSRSPIQLDWAKSSFSKFSRACDGPVDRVSASVAKKPIVTYLCGSKLFYHVELIQCSTSLFL